MTEELREKIIKMAKCYASTKNATFKSVAEKFEVSDTTAKKYLNILLKDIDFKLWIKVQKKKTGNIERTRQNFVKPQKKCLLGRLFKK